MKASTCFEHGTFALPDKPKPEVLDPRDAVVRVTVNVETFCSQWLFRKKGFVNNCADPNGGIRCDRTIGIIKQSRFRG